MDYGLLSLFFLGLIGIAFLTSEIIFSLGEVFLWIGIILMSISMFGMYITPLLYKPLEKEAVSE